MIFSYNWLKDYVKLPKPDKLAEILTMHSFEVEQVKKSGKDWTLDIDVQTNRAPDCFSHIGIAREVAAIDNSKIKELKFERGNLQIELDKLFKKSKFSDEEFSKKSGRIDEIYAIILFLEELLKKFQGEENGNK